MEIFVLRWTSLDAIINNIETVNGDTPTATPQNTGISLRTVQYKPL